MSEEKAISITQPIDQSFKWMKKMLFDPFDIGKWFVLGFSAFLMSLGRGGSGGNFGNPFGSGRGGRGGPEVARMLDFLESHMGLILAIVFGAVLLGVALGALLTWLSSRGAFMFLDGVVRNRALVKEPWRLFKDLGNSLFLFRFVLGLIGLGGVILIGVICWLIAKPDIADRRFGTMALISAIVGGLLLLVVIVVLGVITLLLLDFVVPVMYRRGLGVVPAFKVFNEQILSGHVVSFILFYLMKIVLGLAAAVIIMVGTCVTCCIAALPYLSSVFFLPIYVFFQAFNLYFMGQFGKEWQFLPEVIPAAVPPEPPVAEPTAGLATPETAPPEAEPQKPAPTRLVWTEPQPEEPPKEPGPPTPPPPIE